MKLRKGDKVVVITGKEKGKQGEIFKVDPENMKVWVKGLNIVKKHQRPTQKNRQGGIIEKESPIHISNVMCFDDKANKPSRIGYKIAKDGKKIRYLKKSGETIEAKTK